MAISSKGTVLKYGETTPDTEIVIKDTPVILAKRSSIETTTLSDDQRTFIPGLREGSESFDFTCNYDATVFETLNGLTDKDQKCALVYSDGSGYTWTGKISASVSEAAVDAVLEMVVSITPSTTPIWVKNVNA